MCSFWNMNTSNKTENIVNRQIHVQHLYSPAYRSAVRSLFHIGSHKYSVFSEPAFRTEQNSDIHFDFDLNKLQSYFELLEFGCLFGLV